MEQQQSSARPGRSLDEYIADREARDPEFAAAGGEVAPAIALASAVLAARSGLRMTQADLARRMGTTNTAISRLESGRQEPTVGTLRKLSDILGLSFRITPDAIEATPVVVQTRAGGLSRPGRIIEGRLIREATFTEPVDGPAAYLVVAPDTLIRGRWQVLGDEGVLEQEPTQGRAVEVARRLLRTSGGTLEIRRRNGGLREVREVSAAS